jgi:hypothetical protein
MHTAQIVIAIDPLLIAEFGHLICLKFERVYRGGVSDPVS